MSTGIYLFCLTPADPLPEIAGKGIDELHPLFVETIEGVAYILSEVSLEDFSGPDAQENKPVGLVYIALSYGKQTHTGEFRFKGNREKIKKQASTAAIEFLWKHLKV